MNVLRPTESETWRQRIGALALVAVGLLFIWRSLADLPFGTIDNPGPGITPLVLAVLLVVFALWSMAGGAPSFVDGEDPADAIEPADAVESGATRHAIVVIAGTLAAALAF